MDYDSSRIIDSNGTKYKVGWNEYGWFSIERVWYDPTSEEYRPVDNETVEVSFTETGAEELIEEITEGL